MFSSGEDAGLHNSMISKVFSYLVSIYKLIEEVQFWVPFMIIKMLHRVTGPEEFEFTRKLPYTKYIQVCSNNGHRG